MQQVDAANSERGRKLAAAIKRGDAAVADYAARGCIICGAAFAPFGFAPPATRRWGWACLEHREEAEARLSR